MDQRAVHFSWCISATGFIEITADDPFRRWSFPFQFLDRAELQHALLAARLPLDILQSSQPSTVHVTNDQLDILAYWQDSRIMAAPTATYAGQRAHRRPGLNKAAL